MKAVSVNNMHKTKFIENHQNFSFLKMNQGKNNLCNICHTRFNKKHFDTISHQKNVNKLLLGNNFELSPKKI